MSIYKQLTIDLDFDREEAAEVMRSLKDQSADFTVEGGGAEYRFIHQDHIDEIQKDELSNDQYVLGCCAPWFISDITGLPLDEVEKAQKNESFELLGALMMQHIDKVQEEMAAHDGYGHHFATYDGDMHDVGDYYAFRTN